MYPTILTLHSILRWVVLAAALWAVFRFVSGWLSRRKFTEGDATARKVFTITLDVQFLLGLILLFISPIIAMLVDDFSAGMKTPEIRRIGMEHTLLMLASLTLAHIGAARSKKGTDDTARLRSGAIFFLLSLVAMLAGIPWWRPMMRMFGE